MYQARTILACMGAIVIRASTVSLVGTIAALAAAVIGFCIWTTPWARRLTGRDLTRALRTEGATLAIGYAGQGVSSIDISLLLRNESDIAVTRFIRKFDISWGMTNRPLQGEPQKDDVFERQSKSWQAARFVVRDADVSTFTLDYVIEYGGLDRSPRMQLVGQRIGTVAPLRPQILPMSETHPDRHSRIKQRGSQT
jgi:hypothetical protein